MSQGSSGSNAYMAPGLVGIAKNDARLTNVDTTYQDAFADLDIPDYLKSVAANLTSLQQGVYNISENQEYRNQVAAAIKKQNDTRAAARTDFEASQAGSALQKTPIGTGGPQTTVDKATAPVIGQPQLSNLLGDDERNLLGL